MKRGLFFIFVLIAGCTPKHTDPGFVTVEGKWTYTTPDSKVSVNFDLKRLPSGDLAVQNYTIKLDGTSYQAAAELTGVALPAIQKIRVNANDSHAVFPYNIEFNTCTVSTDFKTIAADSATYTWPWGTTNTLTSIKIVRRV